MRLTLAALLALAAAPALAAEGMWMPSQLPALADRLAADGLALPPRRLGDLSAAPMRAIAWLGNCSASFVSPQGLVLTNHHCIGRTLQHNSRAGENLLRDGFLASTQTEERRAAPDARIFMIDALDDVTADMMAGLAPRLTGAERHARLQANRLALIAACEAPGGRRCDVRAAFGGAQWWRQTMTEVPDVRLVYAPAESVGNFGGEVDNWQWPRHTGDFALLRAWGGPDGRPRAWAPDNVPLRPPAHLTMATGPLEEGDFVMIAGFPGVTERFRTTAETRAFYERIYPLQRRLLAEQAALLTAEAQTEDERIAVSEAIRRAENIMKKLDGQMEVAGRVGLAALKEEEDRRLGDWAAQPRHRRTHALAIVNWDSIVPQAMAAEETRLVAQTLDRALLLRAARDLYRWAEERERPDAEREPGFQDRDRQPLADRLAGLDRQYVARIDRLQLERALAENARLPEAARNLALETAIAEIGLDRLYGQTRLADRETRLAWLDRPAADFRASDDPFVQLAVRAAPADRAAEARAKERLGRTDQARTAWMQTVQAFARAENRNLYPDANGSLRVSWGRVAGRPLADGMAWTAFTTPAGLLQKERGEEPFASPAAMLQRVRARDWQGFASDRQGTLPVNFLATTDITNGNSGSAVLNARGELVGVAFDGTLDGMLSDWRFDPEITRTISVDLRYMGWVLDVDGATHLLSEMGLSPPTVRPAAR